MKYTNKAKRRAFTLIELLIVIAIIGILFVVLVSKVDFATDKAKASGVQTDFRSFQVAFDTVAKENAGFASLGWDTGDENGNRKRDSYDEGDTNKNNIMESTETWTGHKVPGEDWTGTYTLLNPKETDDTSAFKLLEDKVNANLDPKLHITITPDVGEDGKLTGNAKVSMANAAKDPWKNEYHGVYITNAQNDNGDRGAFIIYSNGANGQWGSEHSIADGKVSIIVPGNNVRGKDDYSIAVFYTYKNGYGENALLTTGFSNNQNFFSGGTGSVETVVPESPAEPVDTNPFKDLTEAGLYQEENGSWVLKYTFDELVEMEVLSSSYGSISAHFGGGTRPSAYAKQMLDGYLVLPEKSFSIPEYGFNGCSKLIGMTLPDGAGTIYQYSLRSTGIKHLYFKGGVGFQYYACDSVANIYLDDVNDWLKTSFYKDRTSPCGASTKIYVKGQLLENLVVPEGVTQINAYAFESYKYLKSVELSSTVTSIGKCAFNGCSSLESINLSNIKTIRESAFASSLLKDVDLSSTTHIYVTAFNNCQQLESVKLSNALQNVKYGAFSKCPKLNIYYSGTLNEWMNLTFEKQTNENHWYAICEEGTYHLYINNELLAGTLVIPDGITEIKASIFAGVVDITDIDWNDVEVVNEYAFAYCLGLDKVDISDNIKSLGGYAFRCSKNITEVNISENSQLTHMGNGVFYGLANIKTLYIPVGITRLETPALVWECKSIESLVFADNTQLEYLEVSVYGTNSNFTIYLPDSVKTIKGLDLGVNSCGKIVIGENSQLERIEDECFDGYYGSLYLPKNLYYISPYAQGTSWGSSPSITIHPENIYFKKVNNCIIDVNAKMIIWSSSNASIPTDGSVTAINIFAGTSIRHIPIQITSIHSNAWYNRYGTKYTLMYEGTMAQMQEIIRAAGGSLYYVTSITCSDGKINGQGTQI